MFQKFIITVVIILLIWYGFKWFGWIQRRYKNQEIEKNRGSANYKKKSKIEEMIQCSDCGAFVPDDGRHSCE